MQRRCITIAAAAVCLLTVPEANASPPTRTVNTVEGFFAPAGEVCPSFGVIATPDRHARSTTTVFANGREVTNAVASPTLTNADTGQSVVQRSRYIMVVTTDEETGDTNVEIDGRFFVRFFPGDVGPGGTVMTEVKTLSVVGHQAFTVDHETFAITAYSLDGQIIRDLCEVLAG
jgi:hypothetical protein